MEDITVKIINPNNEVISLKYSDILYFCQRKTEEFISLSEKNLKEFVEFRKNYSFFDPYFDFVMLKLKYVLINPLFYQNTYLLPYEEKYYIMDLHREYKYAELIEEKPNFSFDFLPANNYNICIQKDNYHMNDKVGFYLDTDGIVYLNHFLCRHLKMARLILNQKMIHSISLTLQYRNYIDQHGENYLCEFLNEKLGYVIGFPSDENRIIYNSKKLTQPQINYLNTIKTKHKIKMEDNNRKFR